MTYQLEWSADFMKVYVKDAYSPNRFVARSAKYTEEEKIAYRAKREAQTPHQNLVDLMRDSFLASWAACEIAKWMEVHCPGYTVRESKTKTGTAFDAPRDVTISFASRDHAMLFKLTWA